MASQLTKRGYKYRSLPTNDTDTFGDFLNDDSEFNIKKLDADLEKLDDKVLLDGERKQNFNFVRSNVEQGGLIEAKNYNGEIQTAENVKTYDIREHEYTTIVQSFSCSGKEPRDAGHNIILNLSNSGSPYVSIPKTGYFLHAGIRALSGTILQTNATKYDPYVKNTLVMTIDHIKKEAVVYINNQLNCHFSYTGKIDYIQPCYYSNSEFRYSNLALYDLQVYNRILTPQEAQRNFSILNNSPALKELHTTDSTGKTSILKLASDTDHVEDRAGRTQEQINRTFYKRGCKEFTSADGSPITVNNGEEGYVLSCEVKGNTFKNYAKMTNTDNKHFKKFTQNANWSVYDVPYMELDRTKKYFIRAEVIKNTLTNAFMLTSGSNVTPVFADYSFTVPAQTTGVFEKEFTPHASNTSILSRMQTSDGTGFGEIVLSYSITEVSVQEPVPFGLSSTQAIISNNGQQYPIYEPTIQGKTRILKAPKGTQNWVEISVDEARDTATYDYKLDSVNGDLGGTPSVNDYIDRARKVKVVNTKEVELNTLTNWQTATTDGSITRFFNLSTSKEKKTGNSNIVCNSFTTGTSGATFAKEVSGYDADGRIYIKLPNSIATTVEQLNTYLTQQKANGTPVTVRYQLATPVEVPLTDEEFKAYDAYKKVISLPFAEDKVTLNEDGSATWVDKSNCKSNSELIQLPITDAGTQTTTVKQYAISVSDVLNSYNQINSICDNMNIYTADELIGFEKVGISSRRGSNAGLIVSVASSEVGAGTVEEFRQWLAAANFNILYKTINEITTHIPKELVPTILTHNQTNILEVGGAVKPSSFKVTVPTTDGVKKEYVLTPINGWTGTAKANLLQTGDVGLVLDLTIPSSFNVAICSLATELRPKAERTVLGYNGNTPVVVKIGTDGTIKLPISTTGTVKLDDTYKL